MKTLKYLGLLLVSVMTASCGDNSDEPGNPGSHDGKTRVTYIKKANCPDASMPEYAVTDGEIYFANSTSFIKYSPSADKWTTLTPAPFSHRSLFIFEDRIFCEAYSSANNGKYLLYAYDKTTDSWTDAEEILGCAGRPTSAYTDQPYAVLGGKLFYNGYYSGQDRIYNPDTKSWEKTENIPDEIFGGNIFIKNNNTYYTRDNSIYQFNINTLICSEKVNVGRKYPLGCAYDSNRMLCIDNAESRYGENKWLYACLYTPESNEFTDFVFCNYESSGECIEIPVITDKIINVGGRFFVGPTNAAFYEIKFNL